MQEDVRRFTGSMSEKYLKLKYLPETLNAQYQILIKDFFLWISRSRPLAQTEKF